MPSSKKVLMLDERISAVVLPVLIALIAICVILPNISGECLWQDEAQTALISKTVLANGLPMVTDGINSFSQELGAEAGPDGIFKWHPWASYYLLALFFKLFGISTFTARLPFALFGVATVVLVYFFTLKLTDKKETAVLAAVLLTFSVPFLLLSRQCRYYPLVMFFNLLGLYGYLCFTEKKGRVTLLLASILLFYTQNLYYFILWAAILGHGIYFIREKTRSLLTIFAISLVACLPWLIYVRTIKYTNIYSFMMTLPQFYAFLSPYFSEINNHIFNPFIFVVIAITLGILHVKGKFLAVHHLEEYYLPLTLPLLYVVCCVLMLSFFSVAPLFRYLAPLLPLASATVAMLLATLFETSIIAGVTATIIILLIEPLPLYFYEITHTFRGPVEGITAFLNTNAKKTDIVAITYEDMPLKFYTNLRVIGGLTGESAGLIESAQWIIVRKNLVSHYEMDFRNYLNDSFNEKDYQKIEIDAPDTEFQNREDPLHHLFMTSKTTDKVTIYHKMNKSLNPGKTVAGLDYEPSAAVHTRP